MPGHCLNHIYTPARRRARICGGLSEIGRDRRVVARYNIYVECSNIVGLVYDVYVICEFVQYLP